MSLEEENFSEEFIEKVEKETEKAKNFGEQLREFLEQYPGQQVKGHTCAGHVSEPEHVFRQRFKYPKFPKKALGCPENCWDECSFERRGFGYQDISGWGCGKYVHPGDSGFKELKEYYDTWDRIREMSEELDGKNE